MKRISISELRKNIKLYSSKVKEEDILVPSNGKPIMKITDPMKDNIEKMKSLQGIINTEKTFEEIMEEKTFNI